MKTQHGKIWTIMMMLAVLTDISRADEQLPLFQAGNERYTNVTITSVSTTDVYFIYAGGMANEKLKDLTPEWQRHFNYDPKKVKAEELKQADNNLKFHDQLLHQPVVHPPDMTRTQTAPAAQPSELVWCNDLPGALKQAKSEDKLVLLDFTGSDWCPWCIKFDQDILATPKFAAYAAKKLELIKVDFPDHTQLPAALRSANNELKKNFSVDGFPTFVLVNGDGKELGRQVGYLQGGPDAFIAELEKFSRR